MTVSIHFHRPDLGDRTANINGLLTTEWQSHWSPGGDNWPDIWCAYRQVGECIEVELEVSNASFTVGRKARPGIASCTVSVSASTGWTLMQDLPRPWPNLWPTKRAAWRRFALYPSGRPNLRVEAGALARGSALPSPAWATWGPANMPLPALSASLTASLPPLWEAHYQGLRTALLTGAVMGWYAEDSEDSPRGKPNNWIVHGPDNPGAPAGSGVYFSTGWQREPLAKYLLLMCQPCHERMWHAYDRATGRPIVVDDYGALTPKYSPGTHDPNNNDLPEFRDVPTNDMLPDPYDTAHRIRHDRYCIAAFELTGSPMARRMVYGAAAQCRLQWTERGDPHDQYRYDLDAMFSRVQANPHQGLSGTYGGRSMGEPAFVIAAAKKFGMSGGDDWAKMFCAFCDLAAPHHGVIQRANGNPPKPDGTIDVWYNATNDMAHSFEVPMLGIGALAVARQFGLPVPRQIATAMRSVFCDPALLRPYYSSNVGPWDYIYVAAHDGLSYDKIPGGQTTPGSPEGDATHAELGCAIGESITGDPAFIDAMCGVGLPAADPHAKRVQLEAGTDLGWGAFALAQLQKAGV
jgi:hypothetical protein